MADYRDTIRAELKYENCVMATQDDGSQRVIFTREPIWHPDYETYVEIVPSIQPRADGKPGSDVYLEQRFPNEISRLEEFSVIESPKEIASMVHLNNEGVRVKDLDGRQRYIATAGFYNVDVMENVRAKPISYTPASYGGEVCVAYVDPFGNKVGERVVQVPGSYPLLCTKLQDVGYDLRTFELKPATAKDRENNKIVLHGVTDDGERVVTTHVGPCSDEGKGAEVYRVRSDSRGNQVGAYIYVKESVDDVTGLLRAVGQAPKSMAPRRGFTTSQHVANALWWIKPGTGRHFG